MKTADKAFFIGTVIWFAGMSFYIFKIAPNAEEMKERVRNELRADGWIKLSSDKDQELQCLVAGCKTCPGIIFKK